MLQNKQKKVPIKVKLKSQLTSSSPVSNDRAPDPSSKSVKGCNSLTAAGPFEWLISASVLKISVPGDAGIYNELQKSFTVCNLM